MDWGMAVGGGAGLLGSIAGPLMNKWLGVDTDPWEIYMKTMKRLEPGRKREVLEGFGAAKAQAGQSMVSRGLSNATTQGTMEMGMERAKSKALANMRGGLSKEALGAVPTMMGGSRGSNPFMAAMGGLAQTGGKLMGQSIANKQMNTMLDKILAARMNPPEMTGAGGWALGPAYHGFGSAWYQ